MITRRWPSPCKEDASFVCLLKACGRDKDLQKGIRIHFSILEHYRLLELSPYVAHSLISMYAKCGEFRRAREVLEELPTRNVVSWNALISGYTHRDRFCEASKCFEEMVLEGLSPDEITFLCVLKCCARTKAVQKGKLVHGAMLQHSRRMLETHIDVGNALVDMYGKCGKLQDATTVLEKLPVRNVVSWNTLMEGYNSHGRGREVIELFRGMRDERISPDDVSFLSILKACGSTRCIDLGERIHDEIVRRGLLEEKDVVLGTALLDMYAKCGRMNRAKEVLEGLSVQDVVPWNALILGYAQLNRCHEASICVERMRNVGLSPDSITFLSILKACGSHCSDGILIGKKIHSEVLNAGFLQKDVLLGHALVVMYAKCGMLMKARRVLEDLPDRNVVSWSALIEGHGEQGAGHEAVRCFEQMIAEGFSPDVVTFVSTLKACGSIRAVDKGKQIHEDISRRGLLQTDIALVTALVDMYAKCGMTVKAEELLERLPARDVVSWNALIAGFVEHGRVQEALGCFERMKTEGLCASEVTFICILKACISIGDIDRVARIHGEIRSEGLLDKDAVLATTLADAYMKLGFLGKALEVLENLHIRNAVSWNVLISGYVESGQFQKALNCLDQMQSEGLPADAATFVSMLKACGGLGALHKGMQIHDEVSRRPWLEKDMSLQTAVIYMYAKCGMLDRAREVLENLPFRDIVCWSALISGYADQRQGHKAIDCFGRMQSEGLSLDEVTFLCILSACSRSGLHAEAEDVLRDMVSHYGLPPMKEHLTCMIASLGHGGEFEKTVSMIESMPCSHHLGIWIALLGMCRRWGNAELGRLAFDRAIQIKRCCGTAYILMADILTSSGSGEDARKIEAA